MTLTTLAVHDTTHPPGCTVAVSPTLSAATAVFNANNLSSSCCQLSSASSVAGSTLVLDGKVGMALTVSGSTNNVTINLTGPADVWFGVGFNAALMSDEPYTIVVDGAGVVSERKLANHAAGTQLPGMVRVLSHVVANGVRTVVLSRALEGATQEHYTFSPTELTLNFISAVGVGPGFGPHNQAPHGASLLELWPDSALCVCREPAAPFGSGSGNNKNKIKIKNGRENVYQAAHLGNYEQTGHRQLLHNIHLYQGWCIHPYCVCVCVYVCVCWARCVLTIDASGPI